MSGVGSTEPSRSGGGGVAGARAGLSPRRLAWACRASILLAVVGVFGTWRASGPVSLDGVQGPHDGWLVVIFALVALAGVRSLSRGGWLGIVTVAGGAAAMLFTAVSNLVDDRSVLGGRSGWGIWLTIVASGVLAGCAVSAAARRLQGRSREQSENRGAALDA